jgi:hypothetical protein
MWLHREAPVPPLDEVAPHRLVPPAIEGVVRRALAKDPGDRYASAVQFAAALEDAAAGAYRQADDEDLADLLAASRPARPWLALVALALVAGAAATAWHLWPTWS